LYIAVDSTNENFLVRKLGQDGKSSITKMPFRASLFIASEKASKEYIGFKTGKHLKRFDFFSRQNYWDFKNKMKDVGIYGDISPIFQFIPKLNIRSENISFLRPWGLDIEVYSEKEFPYPERAIIYPIVSLTLGDLRKKKYYTFVYDMDGKCTLKSQPNWEIFVYRSEEDMMNSFSKFWRQNIANIHILTGWNINKFDIPYIIRRMNYLFTGDPEKICKEVRLLSPFRNIKNKTTKYSETEYIIAGIPILDYLAVFKKFNFQSRRSFKLENIAQEELGHGKLENPYSSLHELYRKDINTFINYNRKDTELLEEIDNKFNYLNFMITIALITKINYENVFSPIRCWESLIYNKLIEQNIVTNPARRFTKTREYLGAYVKLPETKMYRDIISYDLVQLYPSVIRAANISPETLIEGDYEENVTIEKFMLDEFESKKAHKNNQILLPTGNYYKKEPQGVYPILMEELFFKRIAIKEQIKEKERELKKLLQ